jgi:hypothetical protein
MALVNINIISGHCNLTDGHLIMLPPVSVYRCLRRKRMSRWLADECGKYIPKLELMMLLDDDRCKQGKI